MHWQVVAFLNFYCLSQSSSLDNACFVCYAKMWDYVVHKQLVKTGGAGSLLPAAHGEKRAFSMLLAGGAHGVTRPAFIVWQ